MATIENSSRILGPRKAKTISIRALIALLGILAMALLIGPLSPSHPAAEGSPLRDSSEPWLEINCLENVTVQTWGVNCWKEVPGALALVEVVMSYIWNG